MTTHRQMYKSHRFRLWQHPLLLLVLTNLAATGPLNAQRTSQLGPAPAAPPQVASEHNALAAADGSVDGGLAIDISTRAQSLAFYRAVYLASENVASGWTGSLAKLMPGTTAQAFRDAIALRINYFRAMAGVPAAITLSDAYNAEDQQAALMMSVNGQLSHSPPASWVDYTAAGADAASHSNLFLGINGPAAVSGYIEDYGDDNTALGHRRWILYPQTTTMGSGDVDGSSFSLLDASANALWVWTATTARPVRPPATASWRGRRRDSFPTR